MCTKLQTIQMLVIVLLGILFISGLMFGLMSVYWQHQYPPQRNGQPNLQNHTVPDNQNEHETPSIKTSPKDPQNICEGMLVVNPSCSFP